MAKLLSRGPDLKGFLREIHRVETSLQLSKAKSCISDLERQLASLSQQDEELVPGLDPRVASRLD